MLRNERAVVIKNARLAKIRNNLRLIIFYAVQDKLQAIKALRDPYRRIDNDKLSEFESIESTKLDEEMWNLKEALLRSICVCYTCSIKDKDMVYNPILKAWNCVDCVREDKVWDPRRNLCSTCHSRLVPCPKCGEFYCPKCMTRVFREMNDEFYNKLKLGFSREYLLSRLDDDEFLLLNGKCSCGYSLAKFSKLSEWRKIRNLYKIIDKN